MTSRLGNITAPAIPKQIKASTLTYNHRCALYCVAVSWSKIYDKYEIWHLCLQVNLNYLRFK
jgi:hypothetical protein